MSKILIVQAVFYEKISTLLLQGAVEEIKRCGLEYEVISVPGAFEIPAVIALAKDAKGGVFNSPKYSGFVALGCVIRGETTHYDYVCGESARGLNELAIREKLAIGYGIITTENEAQALERADPSKKDKGGFAAYACIEMIKIRERFNKA